MLRNIMLIVLAIVLLIGLQKLIGQEKNRFGPATSNSDRWIERDQRGERPENQPPMAPKRQMEGFRQRFGRWLDALTKAYEEKDMEKIGQIIQKMQQFRQQLQQERQAFRSAEPGWRHTFLSPQENRGNGATIVIVQPPWSGGGPRWWGRGPDDRGMDIADGGFRRGQAERRGQDMQPPPMMQRPAGPMPPRGRNQARRDLLPEPLNPPEPNSLQPEPQPPTQELN